MPSTLLKLPDERERERDYIQTIKAVLCNRIDEGLYETEADAAETQDVIERLVTRMAVYRKRHGKPDPSRVTLERITLEGDDVLSGIANSGWNQRA
jgi:hypothetical protein